MTGGYRTAFEVSYFSNGWLLISTGMLAAGLLMLAAVLTGRVRWRESGDTVIGLVVCSLLCSAISLPWLVSNLRAGGTYTRALREDRCEVVEGTVEVLHLQPKSGHDAGDRIRVGGREFQYSYFAATLSYHRTVAHGGALTDGAKVRLHHLDGAILKVEVAE
jgi:hypothetical protein